MCIIVVCDVGFGKYHRSRILLLISLCQKILRIPSSTVNNFRSQALYFIASLEF